MQPIRFLLVFVIITECLDLANTQMLVFYVPFRIGRLLRPIRNLIVLGRLIRRVRMTRRLFRLFMFPLLLLRRNDSEEEDEQLNVHEKVFSQLKKDDPAGCLLRLICELQATHYRYPPGSPEYHIFGIFGDSSKNTLPSKSMESFPFFLASTIGRENQEIRTCERNYKSCPYNSKQMMALFKNSQHSGQFQKMTFTGSPSYAIEAETKWTPGTS